MNWSCKQCGELIDGDILRCTCGYFEEIEINIDNKLKKRNYNVQSEIKAVVKPENDNNGNIEPEACIAKDNNLFCENNDNTLHNAISSSKSSNNMLVVVVMSLYFMISIYYWFYYWNQSFPYVSLSSILVFPLYSIKGFMWPILRLFGV